MWLLPQTALSWVTHFYPPLAHSRPAHLGHEKPTIWIQSKRRIMVKKKINKSTSGPAAVSGSQQAMGVTLKWSGFSCLVLHRNKLDFLPFFLPFKNQWCLCLRAPLPPTPHQHLELSEYIHSGCFRTLSWPRCCLEGHTLLWSLRPLQVPRFLGGSGDLIQGGAKWCVWKMESCKWS